MAEGPAWRSLDELATSDPAATFPVLGEAALLDRRMALRLMGASAALAGLAACDAPVNRALRSAPRGTRQGNFVDYATTLDHGGRGFGVLVRTSDGRPVKIEGNPLHPASGGRSDVFAQVALLSLYDPDRSRVPVEAGRPTSWAAARRAFWKWQAAAVQSRGAGVHLLLRPGASPTEARLVAAIRQRMPLARLHGWDPTAPTASRTEASLDGAELIVCLGADPLGAGPDQVRLARQWSDARDAAAAEGRAPPRLVVAETLPTLTGARAETRLPLAPDGIVQLARAIERGDAQVPAAARLRAAIDAAGSRVRVLAGREQPAEVHAIARRLSGSQGDDPVTLPEYESLLALADAIDGGAVATLLILGGNPAYDAPADLKLASRLRRVANSLHLGAGRDETAQACRWHLPESHPLECWGDLRGAEGSVGLVQPTTQALAPGTSRIELLAMLAGERGGARAAVRRTWATRFADADAWRRVLEDGVFGDARPPAAAPRAVASVGPPLQDRAATPPLRVPAGGLALVFRAHSHLNVGEFANNGWAQELPDPLTKLVWGNAATLAPATAAARGLSNGDEIRIRTVVGEVVAPVWILPGQAPDTLGVTLGGGRSHAGRVGNGVGYDANRIRPAAEPWATGCTIEPLGRRARLITTQAHRPVDDADAVRRIAPGEALGPMQDLGPSLYSDPPPDGQRRWGMVIDLDKCIGCGTCTVACQAENNIPVVGPEEVARGREMHWIRVDRLHRGTPDRPATDFQPVPCMHCETAPCEPVCPVAATVHSSEGLNQMTYSRCIGTRTCSNACPYKVRRFNWFDYSQQPITAPEEAQNPRVMIRPRGVMEKCTYCVQRIEAVRTGDQPGALQTACQQACPTNAIVFGDLADPDSAVARARADRRNYALLDGHNLAPRTTYLARVDTGDV